MYGPAPTTLPAMLVRIRELKDSHAIGTADAWTYLRAVGEYEALAGLIQAQLPGLGLEADLPWWEVSNRCHDAHVLVGRLIESWPYRPGASEGEPNPEPREWGLFHYPVALRSRQVSEWDGDPESALLEFDYESCLVEFYREEAAQGDPVAAWREVVQRIATSGPRWFRDQDGRRWSFRERMDAAEEATGGSLPRCSEDDWLRDEAVALHDWLFAGGVCPVDEVREPVAAPWEAMLLLYGPGADWNRAVAERTLGQTATQLRMALYLVLCEFDGGTDAAVTRAIRRAEQRVAESRKRFARLREINAPEVVLENEQVLQKKHRYRLRALRENEGNLRRAFAEWDGEDAAA